MFRNRSLKYSSRSGSRAPIGRLKSLLKKEQWNDETVVKQQERVQKNDS